VRFDIIGQFDLITNRCLNKYLLVLFNNLMTQIFEKFLTLLLVFFLSLSLRAELSEDNPYGVSIFDNRVSLTRGSIYPNYSESIQTNQEGACKLVKELWGWSDSNCLSIDKLLAATGPNVDTVVISKPQNIGYVKYDDWYDSDRDSQISEIVSYIKDAYKVQGQRIGREMKWIKWIVYPTLVEDKNYIYYAYLMSDNGEEALQIKSSLYDRKGMIPFVVVTRNLTPESPESEFKKTLEGVLDLYTPDEGQRYADYSSDDKVYKYGVIGTVATLAGVAWTKKGKAVAAGIFATILLFAKKLWWLIFIPVIALVKKLFKKKE